MAGADGREVWVLGEMFQIEGIKEWLMGEGLCMDNVCAALEYGVSGGTGGCEELVCACVGLVGKEPRFVRQLQQQVRRGSSQRPQWSR
jgi:hypothetical protein